ncbi:hypothetical protein COW36_10220 [bacterium (Candidatus Blackallbacteria) CG17_big_fil_post_rev_8_21_14_2_50_48_46]|uniref:Polysaccharide biosynthesis protein C-terminal domain-containing protein n=1 Tax=bacterium (Candidatus Blackallbacteria) CG17_big_fil_post_rev_8_21_14_2_50_48_46 TaxID=2014261 RepID=A0A2M7G543_9BACT|nr:MAG: hypothetical protein COW64_19990 [bacterium (Candidatus Blackallbacteria) CG18_big_fil_WC_8_21_14_2_50_49_26]PIW17008.1 MAG: hypothetical protein COW36_10220 [bacterium (Candidatus Blackallbacteria) CG17_big_fil_post_rev_8_21_14_2_50_48_46]PIW48184.1 MAG: hypothetical protein COW20_10455 [bacterium (Candidatus Blackallbacteria) CG13_big_fil_rev_8_21_14_2_50_49_14]
MLEHLKRLIQQSLIYGLGTATYQALSLLILPLFTSFLTPADYGVNSVLGLVSAFIIGFLSLGMGTAIGLVYHAHEDPDYRKQVIFNAQMLLFPGIFCLLLIAWVGSAHISQWIFSTPEHQDLVCLMLLTSALTIATVPLALKLQYENKSLTTVAIYTSVNFINLSLSTFFVAVLHWGNFGRFLGNAIGTLCMVLLLWNYAGVRLFQNFSVVRELVKLGMISLPGFLFYFLMQQGNIYILKVYASLEEIGIYSIGTTFGTALSLVINAFITAWTPFVWSFKEKPDEAKIVFGKIMSYYLLSVGTISIALYLFAKPIIVIFTQPNFYPAYRLIGLSSTVQLFTGILLILSVESYIAKEISYSIIFQGITVIIFISLSVLITPYLKGVGALTAQIFGQVFMCFLLIKWNNKKSKNYINIQYELGFLIKFSLFYTTIIILTIFDSEKLNLQSILLNNILFIIYIIYIWKILLGKKEKFFIISYSKKLLMLKK